MPIGEPSGGKVGLAGGPQAGAPPTPPSLPSADARHLPPSPAARMLQSWQEERTFRSTRVRKEPYKLAMDSLQPPNGGRFPSGCFRILGLPGCATLTTLSHLNRFFAACDIALLAVQFGSDIRLFLLCLILSPGSLLRRMLPGSHPQIPSLPPHRIENLLPGAVPSSPQDRPPAESVLLGREVA
jgi:hypothetical protein